MAERRTFDLRDMRSKPILALYAIPTVQMVLGRFHFTSNNQQVTMKNVVEIGKEFKGKPKEVAIASFPY